MHITRSRTTIITLSFSLFTLFILSACFNGTAYHNYVSIDNEEWFAKDSLHFRIDSIPTTNDFITDLEFRTNVRYPYRNISFVMTQSVRHKNKSVTKTLNYDVAEINGKRNGEGITYRTHHIQFCTMSLESGDTLDIFIKHNMKDNVLPGITDIGVLIERF